MAVTATDLKLLCIFSPRFGIKGYTFRICLIDIMKNRLTLKSIAWFYTTNVQIYDKILLTPKF
jgi:hypothetical protein